LDATEIETASPEYVRRLALRLRAARGWTPRFVLARHSGGRFRAADLRAAEDGVLALDAEVVVSLARLYGVAAGELAPPRPLSRGLTIRPDGVVSAAGMSRSFVPGDEASLVEAYLAVTRALRAVGDDVDVDLRRDDVEVVARFLHDSGARSSAVERVLAMSIAERRTIVGSVLAAAATAPSTDHAGVTPGALDEARSTETATSGASR
jgi:hypothetical protein